jgi:hypothetical protein
VDPFPPFPIALDFYLFIYPFILPTLSSSFSLETNKIPKNGRKKYDGREMRWHIERMFYCSTHCCWVGISHGSFTMDETRKAEQEKKGQIHFFPFFSQ